MGVSTTPRGSVHRLRRRTKTDPRLRSQNKGGVVNTPSVSAGQTPDQNHSSVGCGATVTNVASFARPQVLARAERRMCPSIPYVVAQEFRTCVFRCTRQLVAASGQVPYTNDADTNISNTSRTLK